MCICSIIAKHAISTDSEYSDFYHSWALSKCASKFVCCSHRNFTFLSMSWSLFSEAFNNSMKYLTWSENCAHTPFRKIFDWVDFYTFGENGTSIVLMQLKAMSCLAWWNNYYPICTKIIACSFLFGLMLFSCYLFIVPVLCHTCYWFTFIWFVSETNLMFLKASLYNSLFHTIYTNTLVKKQFCHDSFQVIFIIFKLHECFG